MADSAAIERWKQKASMAQARARSAREVGDQTGEMFATVAESGLVAAAMGYMQGKGGYSLFGAVPLEAALGVAGIMGGLYLDGGAGTHLERIGIGSLNAYLTAVGQGMGKAAKDKAAAGGAPQK